MGTDKYAGWNDGGLEAPAHGAFSITPSNDEFDFYCRAIYVGGDGHIEVVTVDNETIVFKNALAGSIIPVRCKKVLAANTTASFLVGLY